jgi:hypothetical protein
MILVAVYSCAVLNTGYGIYCSVLLCCFQFRVRYLLQCVSVLCSLQRTVSVAVCGCVVLRARRSISCKVQGRYLLQCVAVLLIVQGAVSAAVCSCVALSTGAISTAVCSCVAVSTGAVSTAVCSCVAHSTGCSICCSV